MVFRELVFSWLELIDRDRVGFKANLAVMFLLEVMFERLQISFFSPLVEVVLVQPKREMKLDEELGVAVMERLEP